MDKDKIINGDYVAQGNLTVEGDVIINGALRGTGTITSRHGSVVVQGDVTGSVGITAAGAVYVRGDLATTGTVESQNGDVGIGGTYQGKGRLLAKGDVKTNLGNSGDVFIETDPHEVEIPKAPQAAPSRATARGATTIIENGKNSTLNIGQTVTNTTVTNTNGVEVVEQQSMTITGGQKRLTVNGTRITTDGDVQLNEDHLSIGHAKNTTLRQPDGDVIQVLGGTIRDNIVESGKVLFNGKVVKEASDHRRFDLADHGHGVPPAPLGAKPAAHRK